MRALSCLLGTLCVCTAVRADVVVPERDACRGKAIGDACDGGTCVSVGSSCEAGICRQHDTESACTRAGCDWRERIECRPSATREPTAPPAPKQGGAASCAATPVSALAAWSALAVPLVCRSRRREAETQTTRPGCARSPRHRLS